ncbi:MAG: SH3 domain-containing protein [Clostridia bacterium]|nr:SH3 domain-containing protein [Clostridia bacterium]
MERATKCKECGSFYNGELGACPYCGAGYGYNQPKYENRTLIWILPVITLIVVAIVLGSIFAVNYYKARPIMANIKSKNYSVDDTETVKIIRAKLDALLDAGYSNIRYCSADVCETEGEEILFAGKLNEKYYFSVYCIYDGQAVEVFSNTDNIAYYLCSKDGKDRILSFSQSQNNDNGNYTQNYTYSLFYFDTQFAKHEEDSSNINVAISSTPGQEENEFFEKFNQYREYIIVCIDPYELTGYDLMYGQTPSNKKYLRISNCSTSKSGVVDVYSHSWLNLREGPAKSYNKILIDPTNAKSFVKQMRGSVVTILDTVNIADKDNPVWVKIQIKYADKTLIGYSSQSYINLYDVKNLSVGDHFDIEAESSQSTLTWSVNDSNVAYIDPSTGEIIAKAPGLVMVTVKDNNGLTDSCLIRIN